MTATTPDTFPQAFADAWHTRDGRQIAALFAEDADFVNVTGLWWRDRSSISKAHDKALKSYFSETTLTIGTVTTRTLGAGHALVHCRFLLTGQLAPDSSTADPRSTVISFVLERSRSGWLAVSAHNTDVVPGKETYLNTGTLSAVDYRDT